MSGSGPDTIPDVRKDLPDVRKDLPDVQKDLPDGREWPGGPPTFVGVVRRPSRMSSSVPIPSRMSGRTYQMFVRTFRMSGCGQDAHSAVRQWSGGPPGYPGVVRRNSRMSGSCHEALLDVREWSGAPPGCPAVFLIPSRVSGRTYQMFVRTFRMSRITSRMPGSGREALPDVREWSGGPLGCPEGPLGCPGVVRRPSRMSGSSREALPNVREWS